MDEQYDPSVRGWLTRFYDRVWRRGIMRSGLLTMIVLVVVLLSLGIGYRAHMQGNFHKLKEKIGSDREEAPAPRPGGQEAVTLVRSRLLGNSVPEFLSATILPGRGMNVLQVTAYVPGNGEISLMDSPTVEAAAAAMTGTGADANGQASLAMGGAFALPWADRIWGASSPGGERVGTNWRGHVLALQATGGSAVGGLLLKQATDSATTTALPDGGQTEAMFSSGDFQGSWPSNTQVNIVVLLSSRSIELTVTAKNVGDVAEPIGIGWMPRFAVADGDREQMRLHIPGEMRVEVRDRVSGIPSGTLVPVSGTPYDFTGSNGMKLGTMSVDECFTALHQNLLDSGPIAELTYPASNYGLRLTALTSNMKAMRVMAPANGKYVSIQPQFNLPDPFGHEWTRDVDTGVVVLQPGETTQWKVRLELYSLSSSSAAL